MNPELALQWKMWIGPPSIVTRHTTLTVVDGVGIYSWIVYRHDDSCSTW